MKPSKVVVVMVINNRFTKTKDTLLICKSSDDKLENSASGGHRCDMLCVHRGQFQMCPFPLCTAENTQLFCFDHCKKKKKKRTAAVGFQSAALKLESSLNWPEIRHRTA